MLYFLRRIIVLLPCLVMVSCLPGVSPPRMPDTFLGTWVHEWGRFRYQINPDGTMTDTFIEDNQICTLIEYKVLRVYSPRRVAVLYRDRNNCFEETDWSKPKLGVLYIEKPYKYTPIVGETYRWDIGCYYGTVDMWEHTEKYRKHLLSKVGKDEQGCKNWSAQELLRKRK